jgi:SAM-dependent methyltransferase
MRFYNEHIYPWLVSTLGDPKPIQQVRQRVIPLAQGMVLEVGVGPGVNFAYYDPTKVSKIYALEPNPGMVQRASNQQRQTELDVEFLDLPGERIPLPEASVDTVVSTFTLCTIPGVADAIRGIARVLRPGGKFLFFEHGLSPDVRVRRWQQRTEPLFQWAFEGCHVTRDIPTLIEEGGFRVEQMETGYVARFPKSGSYYFWGVARPRVRNHKTAHQANNRRTLQWTRFRRKSVGLCFASYSYLC